MLVAVLLATTLWSAVLRTTFSGIRSFEESLGISAEDFRFILVPQGGRLLVSELSPCLSGLTSAFDIIAIRRESARLVTAHHSLPVGVIGVAGYGEFSRSNTRGDLDNTAINVTPQVAEASGLMEGEHTSLDFDGVAVEGRVYLSHSEAGGLIGNSVSVPLTVLTGMSPLGVLDTVLLKPRQAVDLQAMQVNLTRWFEGCYRGGAPLRIETAQSRIEQGERLLAAYRFNILIMAVMTLLVCVLLVSQATHASLITLSQELSILRTLGIGRTECLMIVVVEAVIIGVIGALLGITVGYPITLKIASFLSGTASEIYKLTMDNLGGSGLLLSELGVVLTIVAVAVLGALMGGLQALRVAPNLGTRTDFVHIRPLAPPVVLGLAIPTLIVFAAALAIVLSAPSLWSSYLFISACVMFVMGCTPLVVSAVPLLGRFSRASLVMRLASGGVRMSGRGYVLAAMGASVAITLMVALSLMVGSFRATLQSWVDRRLQGDLFISSQVEGQGNESRLSASFLREVSALAGIQSSVPYYESTTWIRERSVVVGATDLMAQVGKGVYRFIEGSPDVGALGSGSSCVVSESAARKLALGVGGTLTIENREFTIQAVLQEFGTEQPMVLIDDDVFLSLYPAHAPQSLIVYLRDHSTLQAVRTAMEERGRGSVVIRDQRELKELVMYLFDRTFRVTGSVRWIVFGIGVLGLVVSGLQLLWERRREVKTLIVIGVSPAQVIGWSVLEGGLVTLGPLVLGVLMGTVMGWALTTLINPLSFGWTLEFSLSREPLVFAAAFVSCVVISLLLTVSLAVRRVLRTTTLSDE
jgi:putative ABC transport system permease protein